MNIRLSFRLEDIFYSIVLIFVVAWAYVFFSFVGLNPDWHTASYMTNCPQKEKTSTKKSCCDQPGRYSSLAALIWTSVSAAICSFWLTSSAVRLVLPRTTIRVSSSTSDPCKEKYKSETENLWKWKHSPHNYGKGLETTLWQMYIFMLFPLSHFDDIYTVNILCSLPVCWSVDRGDCPQVPSSFAC